jgi:hypothetical protein
MTAVPGPSDIADRIARLSPERRALLARRLAQDGADQLRPIPRRDPAAPVPMTFAQWRLWFLEQFTPGTNAWNTPTAARLEGPLDLGALRDALELVVERHATLRTTFVAPGGKPTPVVRERATVEIPLVELTTAPPEAREQELERIVGEEVRRPFDLESDLMVRARVVRLGAQQHVLVLVMHHIACDGWSKGLLMDELCTAYNAIVDHAEPALPELPIEYADFAVWQREWLTGANLERLTAYWRERLAGHAPALEIPTDRPRPRTPSFKGAVEWIAVPGALAERATAIGREQRATPFMTLMAVFKALLHAHSGQDDVLVGSPAAMRDRPELERVVGFFANTLVYRTDLSGSPCFRELVGRVRDTAIGVYAHQDLPFEKVVEALKPRRDPSRNPLVQVNMRVEGREPELQLRDLRATPLVIDPGIARFDLAIELGATDDGYAGYLEYDAALFDSGTAASLARDFTALLEAAVNSPDRPLATLAPVREIVQLRALDRG